MLDRTLDNYLQGQTGEKPGGSSSYFDFVEKKAQEEIAVTTSDAKDLAEGGRDAFVVQVMDDETALELKRKYFS